jgi:hypothetical protein
VGVRQAVAHEVVISGVGDGDVAEVVTDAEVVKETSSRDVCSATVKIDQSTGESFSNLTDKLVQFRELLDVLTFLAKCWEIYGYVARQGDARGREDKWKESWRINRMNGNEWIQFFSPTLC